MASGQYRGMLACFAAASLCLLMGYLTLRPRTVFDRSGIHSRTLLRSYDIAWPGSRNDFDIAREPRSARASAARARACRRQCAARRARWCWEE